MTLAELRAEHAEAGAAFAAAEAAYFAAATRLHAVERVLNSPNVTGGAEAHPTFRQKPTPERHPRFSTCPAINNGTMSWPQSDARAEELLRNFRAEA